MDLHPPIVLLALDISLKWSLNYAKNILKKVNALTELNVNLPMDHTSWDKTTIIMASTKLKPAWLSSITLNANMASGATFCIKDKNQQHQQMIYWPSSLNTLKSLNNFIKKAATVHQF